MDYRDTQQRIVTTMREIFPEPQPDTGPFYAMMQYHLGWLDEQFAPAKANSGKLIRPLLVLLANRIFGGNDQQALPLAAGIQLIHDFSLIHDDIEDNSEVRRGRKTAWKIWGVAQGINTGDGMFALAHCAVHRLSDVGVPAQRVLNILRDFDGTILQICEGQYLDMAGEGQMDVSIERYVQTIRRKTAMLTAAATGLGTRVATDDDSQIAAMWDFGEALGLAFQMRDDLLDIWGDPERTGKPYAADLIQRKMSLPVIHGLAHAAHADRERFVALYRQPTLSHAEIESLLAILDRSESRTYVEGLARDEYERAMQALGRVSAVDSCALEELRSLAEQLLERVH
jgi:geranylgeranyl diphosphate synthase, type I